jgi:putative FmdB family regulatory protein
MPMYPYKCENCKEEWEEEQSIKDKKLEKCKKCGYKSPARLIGAAPPFILRGQGWFKDGY